MISILSISKSLIILLEKKKTIFNYDLFLVFNQSKYVSQKYLQKWKKTHNIIIYINLRITTIKNDMIARTLELIRISQLALKSTIIFSHKLFIIQSKLYNVQTTLKM